MLPHYIIILEHNKKEKPKKREKKEVCFIMPPWPRITSRGCHLPSSNNLIALKRKKTYTKHFQLPR
jgi:hypothetical protein